MSGGDVLEVGGIEDDDSQVGGGTPGAHHTTHETGGSDAITSLSAAVLTSGTLDPARFPSLDPSLIPAHASTHETGGSDPITTLSADVLTGTVPAASLPDHNHASGTAGEGGVLTNDAHDGYSDYAAIAQPATPAASHGRLFYVDSNGHQFPYSMDDDGTTLNMVRDRVLLVQNSTGLTISKGQIVDVHGSTGSIPTIRLALADVASGKHAEGFAMEDIADSDFGLIIVSGLLEGVDTSGFVEGDIIYLSDTIAGAFVTTAPSASGSFQQEVGIVTLSDVLGSIQVLMGTVFRNTSQIPTTVTGTFLISGGQVAWESNYIYRVSAATYYINGTFYSSPETSITLTAAHATLDRIDAIVLTSSSTASKVDGTAAAQPSEPDIDPATQLKLSLVLVTHATSAPVGASNVTVYTENAGSGGGEWNWTTSGSGFTLGSTTSPHAGTKDIEGTAVAVAAYAQGDKPTGTIDPNAYDKIILFIQSKAAWNNSRGLNITLRNAGVIVGAQIAIRRSGSYGFDSTVTSGYQQIAIPILDFAVPDGSLINQIRITDFGGSIGFFIDDIKFQIGGLTQTFTGITQDQADSRYAQRANNLSDLTSAASARTNLGLVGAIGIIIDGGGSVITTGIKGFVEVPFACTITAVSLLSSDASQLTGSITVDIWKRPIGSYPPTVSDTIVASAKPTLSTAKSSKDTTLTGWGVGKTISAGDVLGFKVDTVTTVTKVTLTLSVLAN